MIKNIIFDLGNVLVDIHPERTMKEFMFRCNLSEREVGSFYLSELHLDFMAGRYLPDEFYKLMMAKFPSSLAKAEFIHIWNQVIGDAKTGMDAVITELSQKFTLSICSNTDPWHWEKVIRENSFINKFHHFLLSFQIKRNKPDPYVFQRLLTQLGADSQECLFIDDIEENVLAAEKLGICGIHSHDPEIIRRELQILGLLDHKNF